MTMRKVIVAVLVTVATFNRVRATLVIDGNVAKIIAVIMAGCGGGVEADAIKDFGYGTKFGTQPGKVTSLLLPRVKIQPRHFKWKTK